MRDLMAKGEKPKGKKEEKRPPVAPQSEAEKKEKQGRLAPPDKERIEKLKNTYFALSAEIQEKKEEISDLNSQLSEVLKKAREIFGKDKELSEILQALGG